MKFFLFLGVFFSLFLYSPSSIATNDTVEFKKPVPPGLILRPGLFVGNKGNSHNFFIDLLVPFQNWDKNILMFNLTLNYSNHSGDTANEGNIGLIYRDLLYNDQLILGFNAFYDTRRTINDNRFNQIGFGIETFSQWVDFRANYYHPL